MYKPPKRLKVTTPCIIEVTNKHILLFHMDKWCPAILPDARRERGSRTCQLYQLTDRKTRTIVHVVGAKTVFQAKKFIYHREQPGNTYDKAYPGDEVILSEQQSEQLRLLRQDRLNNFGGYYP